MKTISIYIFVICMIFLSCSSYKVYKAGLTNADEEEGIRFYRSDPYLLITIDTVSKKLVMNIIYLPNHKQEYIIKKKGFIGTSEVTIKLENGWNLAEFGGKSDSKIPETISSISGVISGIKGTKDKAQSIERENYLAPGLYKFEFDKEGTINGFTLIKNNN